MVSIYRIVAPLNKNKGGWERKRLKANTPGQDCKTEWGVGFGKK